MEYQDKMLKCVDCGTEFVFTAGEQLFFHDKQFKNEPKRCKNCKGKRVAVLGSALARCVTRAFLREDGDADELFAVRQGDDGSVSSDPGASGAVPRMLSAGAAGRERLSYPSIVHWIWPAGGCFRAARGCSRTFLAYVPLTTQSQAEYYFIEPLAA